MAIGLKAMTPDDYVYIYDAKQGTKYRVKRDSYNKQVKAEQKRFAQRREEMIRRNQGYVTEKEMRLQKMDNGSYARYIPGQTRRHSEIVNGPNTRRQPHDFSRREELIKLRQNILQDNHNTLRPNA